MWRVGLPSLDTCCCLPLCPLLSTRSTVESPICPGTKHITVLGPNNTQAHVLVLAVPPVQLHTQPACHASRPKAALASNPPPDKPPDQRPRAQHPCCTHALFTRQKNTQHPLLLHCCCANRRCCWPHHTAHPNRVHHVPCATAASAAPCRSLVSYADQWHVQVLLLLVLTGHHHVKVAPVIRQRLLGNTDLRTQTNMTTTAAAAAGGW